MTETNSSKKPEGKSKNPIATIKSLKENSKKRKFTQTVDLIINLKNIDLKKPENRFSFDLKLPAGRGKKPSITLLTNTYTNAKGVKIVKKEEIEKMNRKKVKKLASKTDYFIADVTLMPLVGKVMGPVLAPRNKMPRPAPPNIEIDKLIDTVQNSIRITLKNNPVIQVPVGIETMKEEDILKNINAVINSVIEKLPKGRANIKSVYLKLSMSKPVKMEGLV